MKIGSHMIINYCHVCGEQKNTIAIKATVSGEEEEILTSSETDDLT